MKGVKFVVIFLIVATALFFGVGSQLPDNSHVERSITINAPAGAVFSIVGDLREFGRWDPWSERDPNMTVEYSGPSIGPGAVRAWSGNDDIGAGTMTVIQYEPNKHVQMVLDFGEMGNGTAAYDLREEGAVTTITWSFDTTHPNIIFRYFGLMMDSMLGKDYETGLARLKDLVESLPPVKSEEVTYKVGEVELKGFLAYPVGLLDPVPAVIVVHEWWGHNEYVRERAKMLAELGYVALAVDMYGDGKVAAHPEDANKFMQEVGANSELAEQRFDAAVDLLSTHYHVDKTKIAAIGYCFGGSIVLNMARKGKPLNGVVSFHGSLGGLTPVSENASAPMLVLNGADDPFVKPEHIENFKTEMDTASLQYEFVNYEGAVHGFTSPGATELGEKFGLPLKYNEEADTDSWQRLDTFLKSIFY